MNTKAVLISINPKWCKLIMGGQKTVEVRKSRPKIDTPFKCYIYCSLPGAKEFYMELQNGVDKWYEEKWYEKRGKVIGEFVCDNIIEDWTGGHNTALYRDAACLPVGEAAAYCTQFPMYGWHISDLKIYDTPKELSEFKQYNGHCYYEHLGFAIPKSCNECDGCKVTRSPQSWRYVRRLHNENRAY